MHFPFSPKLSVPFIERKVKNVGRCDHTFIYHIINNYNTLANVTIFTTGSVSLSHKKSQFDFILKKTLEKNTTVLHGVYTDNVSVDNYNFSLDTWDSTHPKNKDGKEAELLQPSFIRPFGKWYEHHFPGISIHIINYNGIFSISREHVYNRSLLFYTKLIEEFPDHSNPEVGHYFERAWPAIFHPIPEKCLYYTNKEKSDAEGFEDRTVQLTQLCLVLGILFLFALTNRSSIKKYITRILRYLRM